MDRTKDFMGLILTFSHSDTEKAPLVQKSMVKDIKDEYTQEAYRIVMHPLVLSDAELVACTYKDIVRLSRAYTAIIHASHTIAISDS